MKSLIVVLAALAVMFGAAGKARADMIYTGLFYDNGGGAIYNADGALVPGASFEWSALATSVPYTDSVVELFGGGLLVGVQDETGMGGASYTLDIEFNFGSLPVTSVGYYLTPLNGESVFESASVSSGIVLFARDLNFYAFTISPLQIEVATPEPASIVLVLSGGLALCVRARVKRRRR